MRDWWEDLDQTARLTFVMVACFTIPWLLEASAKLINAIRGD